MKKNSKQSIEKIKTNGSNVDMYITPEFKWQYQNIKFENYSAELVLDRVKNNSTFLDIGAHYGYYSCLVGQNKKNINIIAIEPVPKNFQILNKNLSLSKNKNRTYNLAASNKNGSVDFNLAKISSRSSIYEIQHSDLNSVIKVKTKKIDDFIKEKIDFVKIDVEGNEIDTLDGMKNIFTNNPNLEMLIEFNPNSQISAKKDPKELLSKLIGLNFDLYAIVEYPWQKPGQEENQYVDTRELLKIKDIDNWPKFVSKKHHVNILCIPKNKSKLVTFFSHSPQLAGSERSMIELIKELKEKDIFSHVVIPSEGPIQKELEALNIPYDIVNLNLWADFTQRTHEEKISKYKKSFKNFFSFSEKLLNINPDIIFTNTIATPWGSIAAKFLNKPHIWHIREYGDLDHNLKFDLGYKETIEYIENNSDLIITNSKSVSDHISKFLHHQKPEVVYNFVNIPKELLSEKPQLAYINKNSIKIIVCGNVSPGKNQMEAVEAVQKMVESKINVELLILGPSANEEYYKKILDYISFNKLEKNIHLIDFVKNPYTYIQSSDIVLIPSIKEAYGRTAVEGMLLKKVVVASSNGGTKEIIDNNKTGYIYEQGNIEQLKDIVEKISDKKIYNQVANNGFESLSKFNSKKTYGYKIDGFINKISKIKKVSNDINEIIFGLLKSNSTYIPINQDQLIELNCKIDELNEIKDSKLFKLWPVYNKLKELFVKK